MAPAGNNLEEINVRQSDAALCNIWQKSALFAKSSVILRDFWVKPHKKCPFFEDSGRCPKILDYTLTGWLNHWKWLVPGLVWLLNFLSSGGGLDCFLQPNVLPKPNKITVTCSKSLKLTSRVNFDLPKVAEWLSTLNCSKSAKMTSFKICVFQIMEKLETSNLDIR